MAQQQQRRQQQPQTQNQQMSIQQRVAWVMGELTRRRMEIEAILPADISFETFHAVCNQAIWSNPEILKCSGDSIVKACIESAYDGLRLDGKDATLVSHRVKIQQNPDVWEDQAIYFPMVRGLIKKIVMGGLVEAVEVECIYKNDNYRIIRGTNPSVEHEIQMEGNRGDVVAVYSVAIFRSGLRLTEVMLRPQIDQVRAEAKTDYVWKKWFDEMAKKSVIRRHEKRLPGGREFRDVEAMRMFPQFNRETVPALEAAPAPRPTRPNALPAPEQTVGYDLGSNLRQAENEEVRSHHAKEEGRRQQQRTDPPQQNQRQTQQNRTDAQQHDGKPTDIPVGPEEVDAWRRELETKIEACRSVKQCNDLRTASAAILGSLDVDTRQDVENLFTLRIADLAADDDAGAAAASDESSSAAEITS